jgi:hypothetical protein
MSDNNWYRQGPASNRVLHEHGKTFARAARRLKGCAAVFAVSLLSACAGMPQLPFGEDSAKAEATALYASPGPVDPKRTRMTKRDIMLEWGTLSADRLPQKRKKTVSLSPLTDMLDASPSDTLTIRQIMANATCHACDERPYHRMVVSASNRHGVPASLIHAVIQKESGYNPAARSKRSARGLMQVTAATGRFVGVNNSKRLYDPQTNIDAGTAYLKYLIANYDTVDEVLAAYNSGPGNVRKYNGVPPFRETRRYVRDVKRLYAVAAQ